MEFVVLGGDGYLGKHLCSYLATRGHRVTATLFTDEIPITEQESSSINFVAASIEKLKSKVDLFPQNPDAVFDFIWSGVSVDKRNDIQLQLKNIEYTMRCMEFAHAIKAKRFIYPGSTSEYLYCGKPIDVRAVPSPHNAYGAAKVATRYVCEEYAKSLNLNFIYAVITGIYSADRTDGNVIYYVIDELLHGRKPKLSSLEQLWDYIYIDDVVCALEAIGKYGKPGKFYAVGHGDNIMLKEYITTIRDMIDPNLPLGIGEIDVQYNGVLPSSCVDLTEIKTDTGWEPKISFEQGIHNTISAMKAAYTSK